MNRFQLVARVFEKSFVFVVFAFIASFYLSSFAKAHEVFHVKKLHVEKGHSEIEIQGGHFSGHPGEEHEEEHEDENEEEHHHAFRHTQEAVLLYGVTDWWRTGVAFGFEKPLEGKFDFASIELENTFVLLPESNGFGFGFTANFGHTLEDHTNSIALGTISVLKSHNWDVALNSAFGRNLNGDERHWGYNYAAQIRFNLDEQWKLGVEAYGEIEDLKNAGAFDQQTHRFGPVLYWSSKPDHGAEEGHHDEEEHERMHLHTELGVLFGISDAANDITLKWGVGIGF